MKNRILPFAWLMLVATGQLFAQAPPAMPAGGDEVQKAVELMKDKSQGAARFDRVAQMLKAVQGPVASQA